MKLPRNPRRRHANETEKLGTPEQNAPIFAAARENARKKQRGLMAPLAAIDAVEAATKLPFDEGCKVEQELFINCLFSDQSKALIHVFFGEREVAKIPDIPKDTPLIPVKRVAVVGAGTMGGGIAMVFANAGIPVLLKEADQAALDRGMANDSEKLRHFREARPLHPAIRRRTSEAHRADAELTTASQRSTWWSKRSSKAWRSRRKSSASSTASASRERFSLAILPR